MKKISKYLSILFIGFILGQMLSIGAIETVKRPGEAAAVESLLTTFLSRSGLNTFSILQSTTGETVITDDRVKTPIIQFSAITSANAADVKDYLPDGGMGLWVPTSGVSSIDLSPFETQDTEALRAVISGRNGMAIVVKQNDRLRSAALTDLTGMTDAEAALYPLVFRWEGTLYGANLRAL